MAKESKLSVVDSITGATADDLQAIDQSIADLQSKITDLDNTMASLRAIRRAIDVRLNGKKPRAPHGSKKKAAATGTAKSNSTPAVTTTASLPTDGDLANRIYDLIAKQGPMGMAAVALAVNASHTECSKACEESGWFDRRRGEVAIRKAVG